MMKFASFENIVAAIYNYLPGKKDDYGKGAQTAVAFGGGYLAGILCAIISHPADVMVSKLNADRAPGEAFGAAMSRIYNKIGFSGLWNGLPVRIVMIGTLTGLQVSMIHLTCLMIAHSRIVDDIRFFQALRWLAYNWWPGSGKGDCQGVDSYPRSWMRWMLECAYHTKGLGLQLLSCFRGGLYHTRMVLYKTDRLLHLMLPIRDSSSLNLSLAAEETQNRIINVKNA